MKKALAAGLSVAFNRAKTLMQDDKVRNMRRIVKMGEVERLKAN